MVAEETVGGLRVCRVCARGVYRALGPEDVRHRRITSTEVVVRRLLSFDYVIEHPGLPWLPTESEKVGAFEALGIHRYLLQARVYRGAGRGRAPLLPARDARGVGRPPRRVGARRSRLRHLDRAPFVAGPAPELWEALREDGLSVEAVGVACAGHRLTGRGRSSGTGRSQRLPSPPRRDARTASIRASRGHDQRLFRVAFEPPCRGPDLSAAGAEPVADPEV